MRCADWLGGINGALSAKGGSSPPCYCWHGELLREDGLLRRSDVVVQAVAACIDEAKLPDPLAHRHRVYIEYSSEFLDSLEAAVPGASDPVRRH